MVAWTKEYDGAAEPDSGGDYDWSRDGQDWASSDGDILTLNTVGQGTGYCTYIKYPDVDFNSGFTLEARVKIIAVESTGRLLIGIQDGTQDEHTNLGIYDDRVAIGGITFNMDTTDGFHIYRITVSGTTIKLYINSILRITAAVHSASVGNKVFFGEVSNTDGLNVNAQIDYLNYKLDEANYLQIIQGILSFTGIAKKKIWQIITGTLSFTGLAKKKIFQTITGILSFTGTLATKKVILKLVEGVLSFSGSIYKLPKKLLTGILNTTGIVSKKISVTITGILSFGAAVGKLTKITLSGTLTFAGAVARFLVKIFPRHLRRIILLIRDKK